MNNANIVEQCVILYQQEIYFKWIKSKNQIKFIGRLLFKQKYNFFVECDIRYPNDLHDLRNDYPLAPEKIVIKNNFEVSDYC